MASFDAGPLRFLPYAIRTPQRAWLAIPAAVALTLLGSLLLSSLLAALMPSVAGPDFPIRGWAAFAGLVLFAPITETLVMAGVLSMLARFLAPTSAVIASAVLWGIAHSLQAPLWGLVIWWPFLIFSTLYMVWRERSVLAALAVAATTHALQNLIPALQVAFG